jgi:hypothetical protein
MIGLALAPVYTLSPLLGLGGGRGLSEAKDRAKIFLLISFLLS